MGYLGPRRVVCADQPPVVCRAPTQSEVSCCALSHPPQASTSYAQVLAPVQRDRARCSGSSVPSAATLHPLHAADTALRLFDTIEDALQALSAGQFVVVLDNEDRENEGDLIMSGDKV